MSNYRIELEKQEQKLRKEKFVLIQQLEIMNKQLHNLQVEYMQISQGLNKPTQQNVTTNNKNLSQKIERNDVNFDNVTEINAKPVSLGPTDILNDMIRGQFNHYKIDDDIEEEDD